MEGEGDIGAENFESLIEEEELGPIDLDPFYVDPTEPDPWASEDGMEGTEGTASTPFSIPESFDSRFVESPRTPVASQDPRITTQYLTKYERARVLGTRALQISLNAPVMVDVGTESGGSRWLGMGV